MQRYIHRLKAVIVEAAQLTDDNASELSNWAGGAQIVEERDALTHEAVEGLNVKTPHGKKRLSRGMYLIKWQDQFYLAGQEQFERFYDPMSPEKVTVRDRVHDGEINQPVLTTDPFEGMTRFGEGPKP